MTNTANGDTPEPNEKVSLPLVGITEIGDLLVRITRRRVLDLTLRSDFPEPEADLAAGEVWLRDDVEAWIDAHGDAVADMFLQGR